MKTNFEIWRDSDNVVKTSQNGYKTQCSQYGKEFTESELKAYFIKEYCSNDKERADEIADLFEHCEELPLKIKEIISVFNTEIDVTENAYDLCKKLVSELEIHGYVCEYGLDSIPHSLRKLETTNETPEEMNTTENDKLIALFMEAKQYDNDDDYIYFDETNTMFSNDTISIKDLKFHSDWNWLMEVVEKIESISFNKSDIFFNVTIGSGLYCTIQDSNFDGLLEINTTEETRIKTVYNACVEFIKFYNLNK